MSNERCVKIGLWDYGIMGLWDYGIMGLWTHRTI